MQPTSFDHLASSESMTDTISLAEHDRRMDTNNNRLKYLFFIFLLVSPIPLGSNRPVFWAFWATMMAGLGVWYFLLLYSTNSKVRIDFKDLQVPMILFLLVLGYALVQVIPLGAFLGSVEFRSQTGFEIVSNTLSLSPGDTWLFVLKWATYGLFFFLILQVAYRKKRVVLFVKAIICITAAHAIYALFALTQLGDMVLFFQKTQYQGNATGTFVNRNSFATYVSIGAIVSLSYLLRPLGTQKRRRSRVDSSLIMYAVVNRIWIGVCFLFLIVALLATQSRMGAFSGVAGLACVLLMRFRYSSMSFRSLALGTFIFVGIFLVFGDGLSARFLEFFQSSDARMEIYRQTFDMIRDRPFTGFGGSSFNSAFPLYHDLDVPTNRVWNSAHSTYLAHWSELGIVFGTMPVLILAFFVFPLIRLCIRDRHASTAVIAAIGSTVTIFLHSLFDFSMEVQAVVFLYLAVLALGICDYFQAIRTGAD